MQDYSEYPGGYYWETPTAPNADFGPFATTEKVCESVVYAEKQNRKEGRRRPRKRGEFVIFEIVGGKRYGRMAVPANTWRKGFGTYND